MGLYHCIDLRSIDDLTVRGAVVRCFYGWSALMLFVEKLWIAKGRKPSIPLKMDTIDMWEEERQDLQEAIAARNFKAAHNVLLAVEKKDVELNNQFNNTPFQLDADDWNALKVFLTERLCGAEMARAELDDDINKYIRYADSELAKNPKLRLFYHCSW